MEPLHHLGAWYTFVINRPYTVPHVQERGHLPRSSRAASAKSPPRSTIRRGPCPWDRGRDHRTLSTQFSVIMMLRMLRPFELALWERHESIRHPMLNRIVAHDRYLELDGPNACERSAQLKDLIKADQRCRATKERFAQQETRATLGAHYSYETPLAAT